MPKYIVAQYLPGNQASRRCFFVFSYLVSESALLHHRQANTPHIFDMHCHGWSFLHAAVGNRPAAQSVCKKRLISDVLKMLGAERQNSYW